MPRQGGVKRTLSESMQNFLNSAIASLDLCWKGNVMQDIFLLLLAAAFWIATHNGLAGSDIRTRLVGKIGENGFRIFYAVLSVLALVLLARASGERIRGLIH